MQTETNYTYRLLYTYNQSQSALSKEFYNESLVKSMGLPPILVDLTIAKTLSDKKYSFKSAVLKEYKICYSLYLEKELNTSYIRKGY